MLFKATSYIATILTLIVIYGSLTPNPPVIEIDIVSLDKWYHAIAYAILFFSWYVFFTYRYLTTSGIVDANFRDLFKWERSIAIGTGVLCFLIGGIIELGQGYLSENRSMDALDLLANTVGILFAALILKVISQLTFSKVKK